MHVLTNTNMSVFLPDTMLKFPLCYICPWARAVRSLSGRGKPIRGSSAYGGQLRQNNVLLTRCIMLHRLLLFLACTQLHAIAPHSAHITQTSKPFCENIGSETCWYIPALLCGVHFAPRAFPFQINMSIHICHSTIESRKASRHANRSSKFCLVTRPRHSQCSKLTKT